VEADIRNRLLRFCWMHTEEERNNRRSINTTRYDCYRQSKSDGVLWPEESLHATRMVSCWRSVPIALRLKTHCKAKAALGTISTWWFIDRICRSGSFRLQYARHRYGYDRLAHHTCESRSTVCAETHCWSSTNGWHIQPEQNVRLRGRHGVYLEVISRSRLTSCLRQNLQRTS